MIEKCILAMIDHFRSIFHIVCSVLQAPAIIQEQWATVSSCLMPSLAEPIGHPYSVFLSLSSTVSPHSHIVLYVFNCYHFCSPDYKVRKVNSVIVNNSLNLSGLTGQVFGLFVAEIWWRWSEPPPCRYIVQGSRRRVRSKRSWGKSLRTRSCLCHSAHIPLTKSHSLGHR